MVTSFKVVFEKQSEEDLNNSTARDRRIANVIVSGELGPTN